MTHEPRESLSSKIIAPLLVVVIGAILVGGSAPWWWEVIFPTTVTPAPGQTSTPTAGPTTPSGETQAPTSVPPTAPSVGGCVLTITYPFATINEEPSHASPAVGDVPPGDYPTADTRIVNWGGRDERWFEITASGRTGWIVYNNVLVDSKSSECP